MADKGYLTVRTNGEARLAIKKSLFIGYVINVQSEEEALRFIEKIKKEHWDATHNCYAYVIDNENDSAKRFSDDGEPSGTAGKPILNVIERLSLQDVVVVVTRYYGGIMLGAGGLIRAYVEAAKLAIDNAGIVEKVSAVEITVTIDYGYYGRLESELISGGYQLGGKAFSDVVTATFLVPLNKANLFIETVNNLSNGEATIAVGEPCYIERDFFS